MAKLKIPNPVPSEEEYIISLEQDGADINIIATRGGERQIIVWIEAKYKTIHMPSNAFGFEGA